MTVYIFVLKGDLNGENRSGAFLFLSGIVLIFLKITMMSLTINTTSIQTIYLAFNIAC